MTAFRRHDPRKEKTVTCQLSYQTLLVNDIRDFPRQVLPNVAVRILEFF